MTDDLLPRLTTALADRHRVERKIGADGMAIVFLAEDLKHHRQVAIKVLKPDVAARYWPAAVHGTHDPGDGTATRATATTETHTGATGRSQNSMNAPCTRR